MKIFLFESRNFKITQKVKHYDLESEGIQNISSWLKKKIQQTYMRTFY